MATVSMDCGIRGWDLRMGDRPFMRLCAWGSAGTQVKWNRQHDHIVATAHGKDVVIWDNRVSLPVCSFANECRKDQCRLQPFKRTTPRSTV
jgi:hypothetical protein